MDKIINDKIIPDESGNNNNALITGKVSLKTGKKGLALDFEDGFLTVAPSKTLDKLTKFTLTCWVKFSDIGALEEKTDNYPTIINRGKEGQYPEFWLFPGFYKKAQWSYGKLAARIGKKADWRWTRTVQSGSLEWERDRWYHIAITVDSATGITHFYRDGNEVGGENNIPEDYNFGTGKIFIGSYQGSKKNWKFKGVIDEFKIYDRILTGAEIEKLCPVNKITIKGRVFLDENKNAVCDPNEKGLNGVLISDGENVISTSNNGDYRLAVSATRLPAYIFVCMPAGYQGTEGFFKPISPYKRSAVPVDKKDYHALNFPLHPYQASLKENFSFIQITDVHMTANKKPGIISDMHDLNNLDINPDFAVDTGDKVDGYGGKDNILNQWHDYMKAVKSVKYPFYHAIGNHDVYSFTGERNSYDAFSEKNIRTFIGITYYSFDYGQYHFVILDGYEDYSKQLSWLKKDLTLQPPNKPVVIFQHEPFRDSFMNAFADYNIKALISGHYHSNHSYLLKGAYNITAPPLSFGGSDQSPGGFNIFSVNKDKISVAPRLANIHKKITIVSPGANTYLSDDNKIKVMANIYDTSSTRLKVQCSLDRKNWTDMAKSGDWSWNAAMPAAAGKKDYDITVRTTNQKNETWSARKKVSVDKGALSPAPDENWTMFRKDVKHTAGSAHDLTPPLNLAWFYSTGGSILLSSPLIVNKRLYTGIDGNGREDKSGIICLDAVKGKLRWKYKTDSAVKGSLAYSRGLIYAGSVKGTVYCIDSDNGNKIWIYQLYDDVPGPIWFYSSPLVVDGIVYVGVASDFVALDARTGKLIWKRNDLVGHFQCPCYSVPAFSQDKVFAGFTNCLAALNGKNGKSWWERKGLTNKETRSFYTLQASPVIYQGRLYCGRTDKIYALDAATGDIVKSYAVDSNIFSTPAVRDNNLYTASSTGQVIKFDLATGKKLWSCQTGISITLAAPYRRVRGGAGIVSSPAITSSTVYIGSNDGYIYGLDNATGKKIWKYNLGAPVLASPSISGNCLYIGALDGNIYAFVKRQRSGQQPGG
ncbi:MAG: PQQ-binding-like beta-propeller repeat protein [Victivallaceae bacterium]|nr:PQQ-binding-like beta-propeller repeat protein [Victivallaceae bacterium]